MHKRIFNFYFVISILFQTHIIAQNASTFVRYADEAMVEGNYYAGSVYYSKAIKLDTTDLGLYYKYAEACRLNNDYESASRGYECVIKNTQNKVYPLSIFWYAMMCKQTGNYFEAKKYFSQYYKEHYKENDYFVKKSKQEIDACEFAEKASNDSAKIEITNLGEKINTTESEFAAVRNSDSTLYFSSMRPFPLVSDYTPDTIWQHRTKVYVASVLKNEIDSYKEMDTLVNKPLFHNANIAFSSDRKTLYFSRCEKKNDKIQCQIYKRRFEKEAWLAPEMLDEKINLTDYTSTQPAIAYGNENSDILYFVSDRPGGKGKMDIWNCTLYDNGRVTPPVNLGDLINSIDDEISPYYHHETQTLYFSSNWHKGFGGYDIFKSPRKTIYWSPPLNLGIPYNSSANDLYFTLNKHESEGYFTSNRKGSLFDKGEYCCSDIYHFKIPFDSIPTEPLDSGSTTLLNTDTILVKEKKEDWLLEEMKRLLPLSLYFHNDEPEPKTTFTKTEKIYTDTWNNYHLMKDIYQIEYSKGLEDETSKQAIKAIDKLFTEHIEKGKENLEKFYNNLTLLLKGSRKIQITLKGYCSPLNSTEYNINLAHRRISSLVNYFLKNNNGELMPYTLSVNGTEPLLLIKEEPVGELEMTESISDNPDDTRNSIYSPEAALSRRIEILLVEFKDKQ